MVCNDQADMIDILLARSLTFDCRIMHYIIVQILLPHLSNLAQASEEDYILMCIGPHHHIFSNVFEWPSKGLYISDLGYENSLEFFCTKSLILSETKLSYPQKYSLAKTLENSIRNHWAIFIVLSFS